MAGLVALGLCASAWADPTTGRVYVWGVRSYQPDRAIIQTSPTGFCLTAGHDTTFFSIDLSTPAGRGIFAIALEALTSGRQVAVEIWDPSCQGWPNPSDPWGTQLRSIYLY